MWPFKKYWYVTYQEQDFGSRDSTIKAVFISILPITFIMSYQRANPESGIRILNYIRVSKKIYYEAINDDIVCPEGGYRLGEG